MSHDVKFSSFAQISTIGSLIRSAGRIVLFLLQFIGCVDNDSGFGSGFVLKFFSPGNFVNAARRNMCDTFIENCTQGLHFFFLRLSALSNL